MNPIQTLIYGDGEAALELRDRLRSEGIKAALRAADEKLFLMHSVEAAEAVYTDNGVIAEAYTALGVEVAPITEKQPDAAETPKKRTTRGNK